MDHTLDHTFESANRVYDTEAVSPTINTCGGGGLQPKIVEINKVRFCQVIGGLGDKKSNNGTQYFQQDRVYSMGDVSLCLPAQLPGGSYNYLEIKRMEEIKELGGLEEGSSQRRKVFDENGVSPTLQAAMGAGGGNVPLVVDAVIGSMQENAMVGNAEYSPSLTEAMGMGGGQIPMITERTCVAMRGRNPENPSDRTPGIELEQRLEVNNTGCTNTLTTVQKDNLVLEKSSFPLRMVRTEEGKALRKDYEAGNIHHGFNEYREPECRTDGVSNTVTTVQKDTLLLEKQRISYDDYNGNIPQDQNTIGTITQTCGNDAFRNGKKLIECDQVLAYDEQNQTVRTETFGTLTTDGSSPKHNNRVIKIKQATKQGFIECEIGGVFCSEYPTSELRRGRVIENGQISPTLTTESIPDRIELGNPDFYNFLYEIDGEIYLIRIRKLIPLECWRLMGFTDEDFKKAEKVNSNTQLYKQAGNSIVCDCLEAIFSQMNIKGVTPWNEKQEFTYQDQ